MNESTTAPAPERAPQPAVDDRRSAPLWRTLLSNRAAVNVAGIAVMVVIFASLQPNFLTTANLQTLLSSITILWVLALGLTFVLLLGGFDLSVGSNLALSGIALGWLFTSFDLPMVMVIVLTILFGALLGGGVNGFLIGRMQASFMVVTLGTLTLFRGLVNLASDTKTQPVTSELLDNLAFGKVAGIPITLILMVVTLLIAWYVLRFTYFGRDVYAVGGNAKAARLAGIRVSRTTVIVYAIAGGAAALGGVIQVARLGAASPLVGETIMFDAAAAVLLGGTSLRGGSGGVGGTAVGVVFLGVLSNGLAVSGVQSFWQQILSGCILASAAVADKIQRDGWRSLEFRLPGALARSGGRARADTSG
ncbi:ABC transporter permease [Nocardioides soli]|uniref:Ribose/xylose/arabinose/galactoside ABC-type transport system permease subunit n=1 Tax=Nocardioides soli TaxID=1036020 RepID=A0A7W4VVY0_9ACTN|nr:ABC transporter permease [Nocardioides soli]MBB3042404.1 ribose/xylose/arabinose/galactoside ABC-type transport system permease subunit [Nocardioides soli]